MRLSKESRYAIVALMELARQPPGELVTARTLAGAAGLPAPYLAKSLQALARVGILRSVRGQGYALARLPVEIRLGDIVAALEDWPLAGDACVFWREECSERNPCVLHWQWKELRPLVEGRLAATSLAEIILFGSDAWLEELDRNRTSRQP